MKLPLEEQGIKKGKKDTVKLIDLIKQQKPASSPELRNEDENYFIKRLGRAKESP